MLRDWHGLAKATASSAWTAVERRGGNTATVELALSAMAIDALQRVRAA
jgi:hypothetical protein